MAIGFPGNGIISFERWWRSHSHFENPIMNGEMDGTLQYLKTLLAILT